MPPPPPNPTFEQAEALALQALAAGLADKRLADRFLSLSGLSAPELRQRAGERRLLAAFLHFLEAHEPDLMSVSDQIGIKPDQLIGARRVLER